MGHFKGHSHKRKSHPISIEIRFATYRLGIRVYVLVCIIILASIVSRVRSEASSSICIFCIEFHVALCTRWPSQRQILYAKRTYRKWEEADEHKNNEKIYCITDRPSVVIVWYTQVPYKLHRRCTSILLKRKQMVFVFFFFLFVLSLLAFFFFVLHCWK